MFERKELGEKSCNFFDHNDCRFVFVYGYDEDSQPVVRVQKTLECPPKLDILGIVLGVIGEYNLFPQKKKHITALQNTYNESNVVPQ